MEHPFKYMFENLWTTIPGILTVVCGTSTLLELIPPPYGVVAMGICGIVQGLGLVAASDASRKIPVPVVKTLVFVLLLFGFPIMGNTATTFEWDRNIEIDVDHYEMYACSTSAACIPSITSTSQIGANIPQPPIGTKPNLAIPPGTKGIAGVIAVDLVGNKSGLSNLVSFTDAQPPANPTNLVTK